MRAIKVGTKFRVCALLYIGRGNTGKLSIRDGDEHTHLLPLGSTLIAIGGKSDGDIEVGPGCSTTQAAFDKAGSTYFHCGVTYIKSKGVPRRNQYTIFLEEIGEYSLIEHLRDLTR